MIHMFCDHCGTQIFYEHAASMILSASYRNVPAEGRSEVHLCHACTEAFWNWVLNYDPPFTPTHRVRHMNTVYELMLVDGVGYTREEWEHGGNADWEYTEEHGWLFQGQPANCEIETIKRAKH